MNFAKQRSDGKLDIYYPSDYEDYENPDTKEVPVKTLELSSDQIENLKLTTIKLGITMHGQDVNDPDVIACIETRGIHPALVGYYMTPGGSTYRHCMSFHEKKATIDEYEEEQTFLTDLKKKGFQQIENNELLDEILKEKLASL